MYCRNDVIRLLLSRGANAGLICESGTTSLQLAKEAAAGEFEEYDDMPSREDYRQIDDLLQGLGLSWHDYAIGLLNHYF